MQQAGSSEQREVKGWPYNTLAFQTYRLLRGKSFDPDILRPAGTWPFNTLAAHTAQQVTETVRQVMEIGFRKIAWLAMRGLLVDSPKWLLTILLRRLWLLVRSIWKLILETIRDSDGRRR